MESEVFMKVLEGLLTQGPLVGYIAYEKWKTDKRLKERDDQIDELNASLLAKQELYLTKTFETISSNTAALNGLKDVITVKQNG